MPTALAVSSNRHLESPELIDELERNGLLAGPDRPVARPLTSSSFSFRPSANVVHELSIHLIGQALR